MASSFCKKLMSLVLFLLDCMAEDILLDCFSLTCSIVELKNINYLVTNLSIHIFQCSNQENLVILGKKLIYFLNF